MNNFNMDNAEAIIVLMEQAQKFIEQQAAILSAVSVNDEEYDRKAMWIEAGKEVINHLDEQIRGIAVQL